MKDIIIIKNGTGKTLFQGHMDDSQVDNILDLNRCTCEEGCLKCDHTGYSGDFSVAWEDPTDERNVYEFISY